MSFFDCFVAAVPTANRDAYIAHAQQMDAVFKDHGAIRVIEAWGDDISDGQVTSYPLAVQKKDDETVVTGWVEWPSREARDTGMAKAMQDPRMSMEPGSMPFDGKRLIYGGFAKIVDL